MKKAFILLLLLNFSFLIAFSQNQALNSAVEYYNGYLKYNEIESLPKAKEKIDMAAANETTKDKFKTWHYRGLIYLATFDFNLKNEMNKMKEGDINKKLLAAYQAAPTDLLDEAKRSFEKEIELDKSNIYSQEAKSKVNVIAYNLSVKGDALLSSKNYTDAIANYEKAYEMKSKMNITDTSIINNLAFASVKLKDYKKAESYYNKLIEMKYKPEKIYSYLISIYSEAGDTASQRSIITKARAAFPDNIDILNEEINMYVMRGKNEQALNSLNIAITKNPNSELLHLVLGQTCTKMAFPKDASGKDLQKPANFDALIKKGEEEYTKALQIKPDYFVANYSLAVLYTNLGSTILKESENMKDPKKVKAEEDKAEALFLKAIPLLEKAHQIDKTDRDTMKTLKQLYARTGQGESEKYKTLDAELKGGSK